MIHYKNALVPCVWVPSGLKLSGYSGDFVPLALKKEELYMFTGNEHFLGTTFNSTHLSLSI